MSKDRMFKADRMETRTYTRCTTETGRVHFEDNIPCGLSLGWNTSLLEGWCIIYDKNRRMKAFQKVYCNKDSVLAAQGSYLVGESMSEHDADGYMKVRLDM